MRSTVQYDSYLVCDGYDDPEPVEFFTMGQVSSYIKRRCPEGAMVFGVDFTGEKYLGFYSL